MVTAKQKKTTKIRKSTTKKPKEERCAKCGEAINPADDDIDAVEVDSGVFVWVHLSDCTGDEEEAAYGDSLGER